MQVHCRLREIMRERRIKVETLHKVTGVGREAISARRGPDWQRVRRVAVGKICGALNITLDELFILNPEDIWAPIKLSGEATIHYGSRSLPEMQPDSGGADDTVLSGQYIGYSLAHPWALFVAAWRLRVRYSFLESSGWTSGSEMKDNPPAAQWGAPRWRRRHEPFGSSLAPRSAS